MNPALLILAVIFVVAISLGILARRGHDMNLEQWSVGGRGFGTIFVFLLMAGEIYTTFTFLGGSGWAYGRGAPAFYILCYGAIAYSLSYFLLPVIWRYAQERKLVSQADFFVEKYDSRALGVLVSAVSVAALVPYLVLQLKGLGIIVSEASYGRVSPTVAVWTGSIALMAYVVISGVRGSAWTAALKDVMILGIVLFLGIYLPYHYYGGYGAMFATIEAASPGFLTLPASGMSASWFISTVILTALGFFMWPQYFASTYTARSDGVFRRNAVLLPLYQLIILFVFFVGFAAIRVVPGLTGSDADLSLLRISRQTFGAPVLGLIGGAGLLTALVPGSMILISAATILAQNVVRPFTPRASDRSVAVLARTMVPVVAVVSALLTLHGSEAIVPLLLMGYNFVTQLFPACVLAFGRRPVASTAGAFAGIAAGALTVAVISLSGASVASILPWAPQVVQDLNVGIVALIVNVIVLVAVSLVTRRPVERTVPASEDAARAMAS